MISQTSLFTGDPPAVSTPLQFVKKYHKEGDTFDELLRRALIGEFEILKMMHPEMLGELIAFTEKIADMQRRHQELSSKERNGN